MRLRCAFFPYKPEFFLIIGKNPDLWGPIWITSTLIFLLFAAGNFSNYLSSDDKDNFEYEYSFVPVALITVKLFNIKVYGIGFITPILLVILFRIFGNPIGVFNVFFSLLHKDNMYVWIFPCMFHSNPRLIYNPI